LYHACDQQLVNLMLSGRVPSGSGAPAMSPSKPPPQIPKARSMTIQKPGQWAEDSEPEESCEEVSMPAHWKDSMRLSGSGSRALSPRIGLSDQGSVHEGSSDPARLRPRQEVAQVFMHDSSGCVPGKLDSAQIPPQADPEADKKVKRDHSSSPAGRASRSRGGVFPGSELQEASSSQSRNSSRASRSQSRNSSRASRASSNRTCWAGSRAASRDSTGSARGHSKGRAPNRFAGKKTWKPKAATPLVNPDFPYVMGTDFPDASRGSSQGVVAPSSRPDIFAAEQAARMSPEEGHQWLMYQDMSPEQAEDVRQCWENKKQTFYHRSDYSQEETDLFTVLLDLKHCTKWDVSPFNRAVRVVQSLVPGHLDFLSLSIGRVGDQSSARKSFGWPSNSLPLHLVAQTVLPGCVPSSQLVRFYHEVCFKSEPALDVRNSHKKTALHVCCAQGNKRLAEALLANGAGMLVTDCFCSITEPIEHTSLFLCDDSPCITSLLNILIVSVYHFAY
jgi:hypothetical protein